MTNPRFDELLKQIKDYAEECNDAQKIIQYLDKLMEERQKGLSSAAVSAAFPPNFAKNHKKRHFPS